MNSVMNKTQLAEIRYSNKFEKDKKSRLNTKKTLKKQIKKVRKSKEDYKKYTHQLQKRKKTIKIQKRKEYELNTRRKLIRRQTESNKEIKPNERKQNRENIIDEDIDIGRFFELATTNKIYVNGLNLHEIKSEILQDYTGTFELTGSMLIGEIEQKTNTRFKNVEDFETYINAIDNGGYDSEVVIFRGWLYKVNTPEFKKVKRSQYASSTDFKQDIVQYIGKNCYIPTSGNCFIKCNFFFTEKDYTDNF